MVNFYKNDKKSTAKAFEVVCDSLDILGRGVCKKEGRVYFVDNLLPGEKARVVPVISNTVSGSSASRDTAGFARVTKILEASPDRCSPVCDHNEQCGGCPLMHIPPQQAFEAKISGVARLLQKSVVQGTLAARSTRASSSIGTSRLGKGSVIKQALAQKQAAAKNAARTRELEQLSQEAAALVAQPAFKEQDESSAYRRACRLAIRADHGRLYLGFRESKANDLVPINRCAVLTERCNELLPSLNQLVNAMEQKKNIGHVELLDSSGAVGVLLRLTTKLNAHDEKLLQQYAAEHQAVISVLEPCRQLDDTEVVRERVVAEPQFEADYHNAGQAAVAAVPAEDDVALSEHLFVKSGECVCYCSPNCFVQINEHMNNRMLARVLEVIKPQAGMKVLDLFCGIGNFSLPIAHAGAQVAGVDIVSDMVRRANDNAVRNGVSERARFFVADLESPFESQLWAKDHYDAVVMDPGRMGAKRAVAYMSKLRPKRIVMISCNPLAAARDCSQLLASHYKIESWGAFDMFPYTSHVEIMLVFTLDETALG